MTIARKFLTTAIAGGLIAASVAFTAGADSHGPNPAIGARKGAMSILGLNMGVLGQMARGNTEYDADTAQAAANNLLAISQLDMRFFWPEGTDNASTEGTRALPAIWEDGSEVIAIWGRFGEGAVALAASAGGGLDAMREALGPVGGACGDCHDDYRAEN